MGSVQDCAHCGALVDVIRQNSGEGIEASANPYESPIARSSEVEVTTVGSPSATLFRAVALVSLVCWVASTVFPMLGLIEFSQEVEIARSWHYFDAALPSWAIDIWWPVCAIANGLGLLGLLCFWRPSRWILVGLVLAVTAAQPFLGLSVASPFDTAVGSVYHLTLAWLITVSFWPPLARHFERTGSSRDATTRRLGNNSGEQ